MLTANTSEIKDQLYTFRDYLLDDLFKISTYFEEINNQETIYLCVEKRISVIGEYGSLKDFYVNIDSMSLDFSGNSLNISKIIEKITSQIDYFLFFVEIVLKNNQNKCKLYNIMFSFPYVFIAGKLKKKFRKKEKKEGIYIVKINRQFNWRSKTAISQNTDFEFTLLDECDSDCYWRPNYFVYEIDEKCLASSYIHHDTKNTSQPKLKTSKNLNDCETSIRYSNLTNKDRSDSIQIRNNNRIKHFFSNLNQQFDELLIGTQAITGELIRQIGKIHFINNEFFILRKHIKDTTNSIDFLNAQYDMRLNVFKDIEISDGYKVSSSIRDALEHRLKLEFKLFKKELCMALKDVEDFEFLNYEFVVSFGIIVANGLLYHICIEECIGQFQNKCKSLKKVTKGKNWTYNVFYKYPEKQLILLPESFVSLDVEADLPCCDYINIKLKEHRDYSDISMDTILGLSKTLEECTV